MSREMKQSGYAWIGDIPQEWSLIPFGRLLNERNEKNNPVKSEERLSLSIELGVTLYAEKTTNLDRFKEDFSQYKLAHEGDLVMNSMNMIVGASGVSKYYGCVSPAYYTFYDNEENHITAKFCEYIFKTKPMMRLLHSMGKGIYAIDRGDDKVNTCRLKVAKYDLKNIKMPLPSIEEQYRIVRTINDVYLKVDTLIANQQKQIEKLKTYKQSLITEAVTKGLNPDVEMKDSGVEWIGEIPEKHFVERLKFSLLSPMMYGANSSGTQNKDNSVRYIRITDITLDSKLKDDENNLYLPLDEADSYLLNDGDVLFARSGGTVGKSFIYHSKYGQSAFAGYLIKAECDKNKLLPEYLFYYTQSSLYEEWKNMIFIQATIQNIGANKYSNMEIVLMNIEKQQEIVSFLDKKCFQIDTLIAIKQQKIEKLNEYKKSIIYEYVTGKKEA